MEKTDENFFNEISRNAVENLLRKTLPLGDSKYMQVSLETMLKHYLIYNDEDIWMRENVAKLTEALIILFDEIRPLDEIMKKPVIMEVNDKEGLPF